MACDGYQSQLDSIEALDPAIKIACDGYGSSISSLNTFDGYVKTACDGYVVAAGLSGGQVLIGGTQASNNLTLQGSSNAVDGYIQAKSRISGFNGALNLGTLTTPPATFNDVGDVAIGADCDVQGNLNVAGNILNSTLKSALDGYAVLNGVSGGQELIGGTAASNNLLLKASSNASDGYIGVLSRLTNPTSYLNLGTAVGSIAGFNAVGDVACGGNLYSAGNITSAASYTITGSYLTANTTLRTNSQLNFNGLALMSYIADDGIHFALDNTDGGVNHNFIIGPWASYNVSYGKGTPSTNPTLFIASAISPATNTTRWGSLNHTGDGSLAGTFLLNSGSGPITLGVTTTPTSGYGDTNDVQVSGDFEEWYENFIKHKV